MTESIELERVTATNDGPPHATEPYVAICVQGPGDSTSGGYSSGRVQLRPNKAARQLLPDDATHVNYYLHEDDAIVGLEPVSDAEADAGSYSLGEYVTFNRVATQLGVEIEETVRVPVEWRGDESLLVFSVAEYTGGESA